MMLPVRTLQQRFVVYMLLPVALLLVIMGGIGFVFARRALIAQWEEAAVLKLQRAAHHVDMRLARPKTWIDLYLQLVEGHPHALERRQDILKKLEADEGVVAVYLNGKRLMDRTGENSARNMHTMMTGGRHADMDRLNGHMGRGQRFTVTAPQLDPDSRNRTVSLITRAENADPAGSFEIEVVLDFNYLLADLPYARWWQTQETFLLDSHGRIFVSMAADGRKQLGETGDVVEVQTLAALQARNFGTLRGPGHPPLTISGFHRLEEAPWYIVVIAPGEEILAPILRFRNYYFLILAAFMAAILMLIIRITGRTAEAVKTLSGAAEAIAKGDFGDSLPVQSRDEIGGLTRSFNTMTTQLKERMHLRQSLDMAKEVQQSLLPETTPQVAGLDIAGRSIYCEETGGDYFDYLHADSALHLVVGDVAGHGISAALLMSSVRASLRQCYCEIDDIGGQISGLNRNLATDVGDSGRFVTLFYLAVYPLDHRLRWVRAGHDPGILYCRNSDSFEDLGGAGLALGVDADYRFTTESRDDLQNGDIILVGTDGIWEACDEKGAMFGKKNLKAIVRRHRHEPAQDILDAVFAAVQAHVGGARAEDDMTLVAVKFDHAN
jgi:sigma-B regulation protein RsbU (phosphoserine phosphatase)